MIDLFLEEGDLLEIVETSLIISEGLLSDYEYKKERNKIVDDSKKYLSTFSKFGRKENGKVIDFRSNPDTVKYFVNTYSPNDHFLFMPLDYNRTASDLEDLQKLIDEINKDLPNYHFKIKYENSLWVYYGNNGYTESKSPTKEDYNTAVNIAKRLLNKYKTIKPTITFPSYELDDDSYSVDIVEYDTWKIKWSQNNRRTSDEYEELFETPFNNFYKELKGELKNHNIKVDADGDEEYGTIYIKK